LHKDDWVVTVFPDRGGGQSNDELRSHLAEDPFKAKGWDVMALIDKYLTVIRDDVLDLTFVAEALEERHVNDSTQFQTS